MTTIRCGEFVKRQTKESRFSYYEGTWKQLESLVTSCFDDHTNGKRQGVILVHVPSTGFYSPIIDLDESCDFHTEFGSRREGEEPGLMTTVVNKGKQPAKRVSIVLYSHATLLENHENDTDADWEIISINASTEAEGNEPMHPLTMARNELGLTGGTETTYTKDDYMKAILYWSRHGMVSGLES
jgi:hypothetical protein